MDQKQMRSAIADQIDAARRRLTEIDLAAMANDDGFVDAVALADARTNFGRVVAELNLAVAGLIMDATARRAAGNQ